VWITVYSVSREIRTELLAPSDCREVAGSYIQILLSIYFGGLYGSGVPRLIGGSLAKVF
jgi:hypothetical protein